MKLSGVAVSAGQEVAADDLEDLTYVPNSSYIGSDSFSWNGADSLAYADEDAHVLLTVTRGNDPPAVTSQSVGVGKNTATAIALCDPDLAAGTALVLHTVTSPSHGSLSGFNSSTGVVTYTPTTNYLGSDSFSYDLGTTGSSQTSDTVTVTINVSPEPTADAQSVSTDEDVPIFLTLTGDDGDPGTTQTLSFALVGQPSHGTLAGFNAATGEVIYIPTRGYTGSDSFTFTSGYTPSGGEGHECPG